MKHAIWRLPGAVLLGLALLGCSSGNDDGTPGKNTQAGRRVPIGKADLYGHCSENGVKHCGAKSTGNCWCDAACVQMGDCCTDAADACGIGAKKCTDNGQCAEGQYCKSEDGCATPGVCTPIPTDIMCTAVMTPYCDCNGKTQMATSGCIWDRYDHTGACESKLCGGIAGLQCDPSAMCIDDPTDGCDPNNGAADCPGICVPKPPCSTPMCANECPYGYVEGPDGCGTCDCKLGNSCEGHCNGKSADGSCYCDDLCEGYGDCCSDYGAECKEERTPASGTCVKNSNDACTTDADCIAGGCGGELCYSPASGSGISTCECAGPGAPVTGCGCVAGKCTWYN